MLKKTHVNKWLTHIQNTTKTIFPIVFRNCKTEVKKLNVGYSSKYCIG